VNDFIFYATNNFLEKITKENFSNPHELQKAKHYQLSFELFKYKIKQNRCIIFIPKEHFNLFKKTEHFDNFKRNNLLFPLFQIDDTCIGQPTIKMVVESATYKSGEEGNFDIIIICCDEEIDEIKRLIDEKQYPVIAKNIIECINLIQGKEIKLN